MKRAGSQLNPRQRAALGRFQTRLGRLKHGRCLDLAEHRERFSLHRSVVHLFEDVVEDANLSRKSLGSGASKLRDLVVEAEAALGGAAEPALVSLRSCDHLLQGPYLGVSDEGSAAHQFRKAILSSPKSEVLGPCPPIAVGAALDAERLAAVGEVAVGPDEYRRTWLACQGSVLTSTNVGTRLNLRYYRVRPTVEVRRGPLAVMLAAAIRDAARLFEPFWKTPDGDPRAVTVFVSFAKGTRYNQRVVLLRQLRGRVASGEFCSPAVHRPGLLANVGYGRPGLRTALRNMGLAKSAGIEEMAVRGDVTTEADDKISLPGLLNYFSAELARVLIGYAVKRGVRLTPKNLVDPDTVARNIWPPLLAARNMGLAQGKYGLFPLTLEESDQVVGLIQGWFSDWSAAPVCYIDLPIVGREMIYTEAQVADGVRAWLDIVASHGIPIVLIDAADKAKGRRLMKDDPGDRVGILQKVEIRDLDRYAARKGIRALWAVGINLSQAMRFGRLGVCGIYVTSAAVALRPVSEDYDRDPSIAAEKEATYSGVRQTKLVLEAGFLISSLGKRRLNGVARGLEQAAQTFLTEVQSDPESESRESARLGLHDLAVEAWRLHLSDPKRPRGRRAGRTRKVKR